MKKIIIYVLIIPTFFAVSMAQTGLPVKKITVFKNLTALVVKEGQLKAKDNTIKFPVPKDALFGTYWLSSLKEGGVKSVIFKNDTLKTQSKSTSLKHFYQGNIGKQLTVFFFVDGKNEKSVTGKIADFYPQSNLIKIRQDNGKVDLLDIKNIYHTEFAEDVVATYKNDSIVRMAIIKTETDNVSLKEYYMETGMNWIPSYYLKLINDKEAYLEMKALIENVAEDLNDVEAEVVVGSPQLYFGRLLDPMTNNNITTSQSSLPRANAQYAWSNVYQTPQAQVAGGYGETMSLEESDLSTFTTEGEKSQDLYYYNLGKISLPKSNKGTFPIFATTLTYKDKYKADIPDKVNYASSRYCDDTEGLYDVFHSIEIKNSTNFPFTTASIMVLTDKNQFLAQDMLKYTPTAATATIKLSKAIDIILKNLEEELTRTDNVKKIGKTTYSKMLLKGIITIENLQQKTVSVDVKKTVNGTVTNNGNGTVKKQKIGSSANPNSEIKWEVNLNAGEKKTLNYEYEVFFVPY